MHNLFKPFLSRMVGCVVFVMLLGFFPAAQIQAAATLISTNFPDGVVGQGYSFQLQATGSPTPFRFQLWYSTYPGSEMTLSSTGVFSGTPQVAGTWEIGVHIEDANGLGTYGVATWKVNSSTSTSSTSFLKVSLDANSPTARNVPAGSGHTFGIFRLEAGSSDISVLSVNVQTDSSIFSSITNIRASESGQFLGRVVGLGVALGNIHSGTITFNNPLVIPHGSFKRLELFADVASQIVGAARLGINNIGYSSASQPALMATFPVYSQTMTVVNSTSSITPVLNLASNSVGFGGVPTGAPNFLFASFTLFASNADVTITGLQVVSDSLNANNAFSNIKVYKDSAQFLGSVNALNSQSGGLYAATVSFSSPVRITNGGSVNLDITATTTSQASGSLRLGIQNLNTSSSPTFNGITWPFYGNSFTVSGQNPGSPQVSIVRETRLPSSMTVVAGQNNVALMDVKVSSLVADSYLSSLFLNTFNSAVELSKLNNIRMQIGSLTVSGTTSSTGGAMQFNLPQPILISRDSSQTFRFIADVKSTSSGTLQLKVSGSLIKDAFGSALNDSQVSLNGDVAVSLTISGNSQTTLQITTPNILPDGNSGQSYFYRFTASGGSGSYTWSLLPSSRFNGYRCCYTSLTSDGLFRSTGDSAGIHLPDSGTFQIGVKAVDSMGAEAEKIVQYTILPKTSPQLVFGFIDFWSANQVSGWAFYQNILPTVTVTFENVGNSNQVFTWTGQPTNVRSDVSAFLKDKFNLTEVVVPTAFSFNPSSVIASGGTYRIRSATFNGINLTLSDNAKQLVSIGSTSGVVTGVGKHVQVAGDPTIYWVTPWGGKMPKFSAEVFLSYGARWSDVIMVSQEILDSYEEVEYIRLSGNARVYKIEGGVKRYLTPAAASRLGIDPARVVNVNNTEFVSYRTGRTIY